ncbi:RidA family protein [Kordiimonas aquimaris]|uniref:RidA family protein n=1 Tax=Kordiimonas aquimaris TaxID=707591 RepID=UPI0021CF134D|nr:RidA family protein [Kordiimonas aquimaris]
MSVEKRLAELGIKLPEPVAPVANYVPFVIFGNMVSISGQVPFVDGKPAYTGTVGDDVSMDDACAAARLCGINLIAQMNAACGGDLNKVKRIVKLGGFVSSKNGFGQQPIVINAASDLMVEVFGDKGRHSRSAVGVSSLPLNVPVEIDAFIELE